MAADERQWATAPAHMADTDHKLRDATEAMQKAAHAMIAVTESFRKQLQQQEGIGSNAGNSNVSRPPLARRCPASYQAYRPVDELPTTHPTTGDGGSLKSLSGSISGSGRETPMKSPGMLPTAPRRDGARPTSRSSHATYRAARANSRSPPSTPIPAHTHLAEFFPKPFKGPPGAPRLPPLVTPTYLESGEVQLPGLSGPDHHKPTRQTTWSPASAKAPKASVSTHSPSRQHFSPTAPPRTVRRPSAASHVDLIEAASQLRKFHSYQGAAHAGAMLPQEAAESPRMPYEEDNEDSEPEPILQIGRYTYVRSDADEFRLSLICGEDSSRRYTTIPLGRGAGSRRCQQKRKSTSTRPLGFSLLHESVFVLVICLSQALMLAGIAQALVPAKLIGQAFPDTSPGDLAWYSAAYSLTSGTFVLPAGRLGDIFGHRRVFIIGFFWFACWSLLAGFAKDVQLAGGGHSLHRGTVFFIVCRAMQGVGPAILVPNGQAMLGRAYRPGPRKNMVMCLFGAAAPLGFVAGAVMSSLFAVQTSWPWAFWTLAAVCLALAAVSMLVLPRDSDDDVGSKGSDTRARPKRVSMQQLDDRNGDEDFSAAARQTQKKRTRAAPLRSPDSLWVRMDVPGMLLGVTGLVLVNFAFNQAPIVGWHTPYTYFLLVIGLLALAAFAYVEAMQAQHPLVPFSAMRPSTNFVLGCTATGWGCFSVWVYYSVSVFENLRGWSPLLTSAAFAPAPVTGLAASLLTGLLMGRGVRPHWVMLISMCAFFVGSVLFATAPPTQLYWYSAFFAILIMPFGMDMSNPAAIILLSNSVGRDHQGIAASLVVTVVNYAISLALGLAGTVEASVFDAAKNNLLVGYRAAQYFGIGLGAFGIVLGTAFLLQAYFERPRQRASRWEKGVL